MKYVSAQKFLSMLQSSDISTNMDEYSKRKNTDIIIEQ